MREMFNRAHVVIVPTKTDFVEGFNQVVVEGVLSGRPVVTSAVCPALSYVKEAVVEVPPDDIQEYGNALLKLCDDRRFYGEKQRSCLTLQEQFYDSSRSWGAVLKSVLVGI
jgi:glycosyltransferase involved in cell wall biosynthesis